MSKRVHYIDSLRVLAVLLLIPFHSARVFDTFSPFYAKNPQLSSALSCSASECATSTGRSAVWRMRTKRMRPLPRR